MGLRFPASSLRASGSSKTRGVRAIRLRAGDSVASVAVVPPEVKEDEAKTESRKEGDSDETQSKNESSNEKAEPSLLIVTAAGFGKRIRVSALRMQRRRGVGVRVIRLVKRKKVAREGDDRGLSDEAVGQESQGFPDEEPDSEERADPRSVSQEKDPQSPETEGDNYVVAVLALPASDLPNRPKKSKGSDNAELLSVTQNGFLLRQSCRSIPMPRGRLARGVSLQRLPATGKSRSSTDLIVAADIVHGASEQQRRRKRRTPED